MSYLDRIATCRRWDPAAYRPLVIDGRTLGRVSHGFARRLAAFPEVFVVGEDAVALAPGLDDFESRSRAVAEVLLEMKAHGEIPLWRDEDYPVVERWGAAPALKIERGASVLLGTCRQLRRDAGLLPSFFDHILAHSQTEGLTAGHQMVELAWLGLLVRRAFADPHLEPTRAPHQAVHTHPKAARA